MTNAKKQNGPLVGILMGSDSDLPIMGETAKTLGKFGVRFEIEVSSAHRSHRRTQKYASTAAERGLKVIIVGAGAAAHLAGVIAAETTLPVIAVPIASTTLGGLDALLASVQMPHGVPVAVMAIGNAGAVNAAVLASQIIATGGGELTEKLRQHKEQLARSVAEKSERVKRQFQV